jgi:NAD(P)-dependent dehydrogenase (short-subunit alcohol dehydrogenase family)
MRLKDKAVVVTGGGREIGRAIALAHAGEGARVAVLSRSESDLEETVELIAGSDARRMGCRGGCRCPTCSAILGGVQPCHTKVVIKSVRSSMEW